MPIPNGGGVNYGTLAEKQFPFPINHLEPSRVVNFAFLNGSRRTKFSKVPEKLRDETRNSGTDETGISREFRGEFSEGA